MCIRDRSEPKFVEEFLEWWLHAHGDDFNPVNSIMREVPYPNISRAKCDLTLSTNGLPIGTPEWAIEVKHIALVGNNGKNNDYGVAKILSPYLKDRSLIHDIERLKKFGAGKRKAVIGYCFDYSFETCKEALTHHPLHAMIVANVRDVCRKNDPVMGFYTALPMIEFANEIFETKGLVKPVSIKAFQNAWRHPCGGSGIIFGWELI